MQGPSDFETVTVVRDLEIHATPARREGDLHACRAAVFPDIGASLLDYTDDRDLLRRSHRAEVAEHPRRDVYPGAFAEACRFGLDDAREWAAQQARRLEGMGELPEDPVELGNPLGQGIDGRLEMCGQLRPGPVDISTERRDMLQGAVVQVEPEPREPSLTCAHEQPLSLRASLQQEVALGNGADRARGLFEERLDISVAHADDQCRPRPLPPPYGGTDDQASLGLSPFENLSRGGAESPGRGGLALGEQTDRCLVRLTEPEGSLDGGRQCDERGQLDLERRQRRELEELRCP